MGVALFIMGMLPFAITIYILGTMFLRQLPTTTRDLREALEENNMGGLVHGPMKSLNKLKRRQVAPDVSDAEESDAGAIAL